MSINPSEQNVINLKLYSVNMACSGRHSKINQNRLLDVKLISMVSYDVMGGHRIVFSVFQTNLGVNMYKEYPVLWNDAF